MGLKRFVRNGQYLSCYAPGDGALAFVWVDAETNQCSTRKVTPSVVRKFQKHRASTHLHKHRVVNINGQIRLVAAITRIGPNTVRFEREFENDTIELTYTVKPNPPFPDNIRTTELTATTVKDLDGNGPQTYEVCHHSTLASLAFFLNHEKELTLS